MPKHKLSDAQRVILSAAGARETGLLFPLPKSLAKRKEALASDINGLLSKRLISERASLPGEEPWATSEQGERRSLVVTDAGLAAVGIGEVEDAGATAKKRPAAQKAAPRKPSSRPSRSAQPKPGKAARIAAKKGASDAHRTTKLDLLIGALRQRKGATIQNLMDATGWQAHSVRGAISGALKKKLGLKVMSEAIEGKARTYRIEGTPSK